MSIQIFATVTGEKQGQFLGESTQKGFESKIPGVGLAFGVLIPYDQATAQASGKLEHQPIVFTKEWGASSTQFYAAAYTRELLTSVIFEVHKTSPAGVQKVDHTIKLTDATISDVSDALFLGQAGGPPVDSRDLQQITLVFQKIEIFQKVEINQKIEIYSAEDTVVAGNMMATQRPITVNKPFTFIKPGAS